MTWRTASNPMIVAIDVVDDGDLLALHLLTGKHQGDPRFVFNMSRDVAASLEHALRLGLTVFARQE